jgi:hypothetical protein
MPPALERVPGQVLDFLPNKSLPNEIEMFEILLHMCWLDLPSCQLFDPKGFQVEAKVPGIFLPGFLWIDAGFAWFWQKVIKIDSNKKEKVFAIMKKAPI